MFPAPRGGAARGRLTDGPLRAPPRTLSLPQCCGTEGQPAPSGSEGSPAPAVFLPFPRSQCWAPPACPPLRAFLWASSSHLEGQGCVEAVCPFPSTSQLTSGEKRGLESVYPFPVHARSHPEGKVVWKVCPSFWIERGSGKCVPLSAVHARSHLEGRQCGRCPLPGTATHIWRERGSKVCVPPCPVHPSPWQGTELG